MNIDLRCGDSLEVLKSFEDNTFSSVVCDPPYGLSFMGKKWDYDVPTKELWAEVLRVLKPGGILLSFAGTRTQHRMAVNIEDAGFEIRDMIAWIYGSGFPKSKNLGDGFGSALKPAMEPITVARKPLNGSLENNWKVNGCGGINIDGCRVGDSRPPSTGGANKFKKWKEMDGCERAPSNNPNTRTDIGRFPANLIHDGSDEVVSLFPDSLGSGGSIPNVKITGYGDKNVGTGKSEYFGGERTKVDSGSGSAARFFYCAKTSKKDRNNGCEDIKTWESVDQNQLTGSLNELQKVMSGNMTQHLESTEWNTFLFGSNITEQCQKGIKYIIEMALKTTTELKTLNCSQHLSIRDFILGVIEMTTDSGSNLVTLAESTNLLIQNTTNAKTELVLRVVHAVLLDLLEISKHVKQGNTHSTVKPTNLMRYLCRLVTPPGGTVLDPFMGSGSTGKAAVLEGFNFVGIDLDPSYVEIARARIEAVNK